MSATKAQSYWLDTAPRFCRGVEDDWDERADVVVIGGGLTGLSAALALSQRQARVVLLEAGRIIGMASGRNGGQCNNGPIQDYLSLEKTWGAERARAFYFAYNAAVDTVERLVRAHAIACDFQRCGKLKLAAKPAHFDHLTKAAARLRAGVDPDIRLVPPDDLRREIGSDRFHGGLLQASSARLHVGRFGVGLADAAAQAGARIYEHAAVTGLARLADGSHEITAARGRIKAKQVLLATGGAGPGPFGWFRRRIVPVGSFIIVTQPLEPALLDRLLPTRRNCVTSLNIGNYFCATPDNRLLFGGRARFSLSNPQADRKAYAILRAALARIFPELADVGIDYCWGGQVDMTADRLPRAGEHGGLFYSMGYSGHGVQMSVHMGQVMADVMAGRADRNPWRGLSWPAIPGHYGKPWFLPLVGAYYRLKDIVQ
ncbi:MAG: FAD-binding oxidoreductase [Alphaproteobacteria bacterium]|nr:MAG: FAD-binding oxidoreductase [Alphaproteobacteria bacterium]